MKTKQFTYREMVLSSSQVEVPRQTYQRNFNAKRAQKIAEEFDERIANEPKVSYRDGRYFVFDGQHTIAARKLLNKERMFPSSAGYISDDRTGRSPALCPAVRACRIPLSAGARLRAQIFGGDPIAIAFMEANKDIGIQLDYDQERGLNRIGCIQTAFDAYLKIGEERYKESMNILKTVWNGEPDSFRAENVLGITRFVDLYHEEYCRSRLIAQLRLVDPLTVYREGRATGINLAGYKKYLFQVFRIYNGNSKKYALKMKF